MTDVQTLKAASKSLGFGPRRREVSRSLTARVVPLPIGGLGLAQPAHCLQRELRLPVHALSPLPGPENNASSGAHVPLDPATCRWGSIHSRSAMRWVAELLPRRARPDCLSDGDSSRAWQGFQQVACRGSRGDGQAATRFG